MDPTDDKSLAIQALLESRPPATDNFTYLTIVEKFLSPEILPTLNEILQDASLTQEIGWDLVQNLVPIPGSDECLETIARLGNPREVIVKALEVLEGFPDSEEEEDEELDDDVVLDVATSDEEDKAKDGWETEKLTTTTTTTTKTTTTTATATTSTTATATSPDPARRFITLLGMLAILHRRIKTKYPSRFLASTLLTVSHAYKPQDQQMTASVINLVQSLAGNRARPPLPSRKSSVNVANPDKDGDASKNAPDPEADAADPASSLGRDEEDRVQQRLLLVFVLGILERFVDANRMAWAQRLVETYNPGRVVPGKKTALQRYKEEGDLLGRDAIVGQLAALARDLGLSACSRTFLSAVCREPIRTDTLPDEDELDPSREIHLPTGGAVCLLAYTVFSSAVFGAHTNGRKPDIYIFPDHFSLVQRYMEDDAQGVILRRPGVIEAALALGLWMEREGRLLPPAPTTTTTRAGSGPSGEEARGNGHKDKDGDDDGDASASTPAFMPYHHLLTLCSVYHPDLGVRSAASSLAGLVLHADPDDDDRLRILEDLLENCMFAALKACAVTWLKEELVAAGEAGRRVSVGLGISSGVSSGGGSNGNGGGATTTTTTSVFAGGEAIEQLQYCIFPDMQFVREMDRESLAEWWAQNSAFVQQAANFGYLLFEGDGLRDRCVPAGMRAAVEERYVLPLLRAVEGFRGDREGIELGGDGGGGAARGGHEHRHEHEHDHGHAVDRLAMELHILESTLRRLSVTS